MGAKLAGSGKSKQEETGRLEWIVDDARADA